MVPKTRLSSLKLLKLTWPKKIRSIIDLPPELIDCIAKQLDQDHDFFFFRESNKTIEEATRHYFALRFFSTSYHLWARSSFNELLEIAQHSTFGKFVETIDISHHSVQCVERVHKARWPGSLAKRRTLMSFIKYETAKMGNASNYIEPLTAALLLLPKLKTLRLSSLLNPCDGYCCDVSGANAHPAAKRLEDRCGISLPALSTLCSTHSTESVHKLLSIVFQALAKAGVAIEELVLGQQHTVGVAHSLVPLPSLDFRSNDWRAVKQSCQNLHTLSLELYPYLRHALSKTARSSLSKLIGFMPQLDSLTVVNYSTSTSSDHAVFDKAFFVAMQKLSLHLVHLCLEDSTDLDGKTFKDFLLKQKASLRTLELRCFTLKPMLWKSFLNQVVSEIPLEKVSVTNIAEGAKDKYEGLRKKASWEAKDFIEDAAKAIETKLEPWKARNNKEDGTPDYPLWFIRSPHFHDFMVTLPAGDTEMLIDAYGEYIYASDDEMDGSYPFFW